jgi:hypothetical protein
MTPLRLTPLKSESTTYPEHLLVIQGTNGIEAPVVAVGVLHWSETLLILLVILYVYLLATDYINPWFLYSI